MINVALLGFGTVGSGTAEVLDINRSQIESYTGQPVTVKYILDRRDFPDSPYGSLIVHDFGVILNDPTVTVVAEMIGGVGAAYSFTRDALCAGKHVVTSNKELVARHGTELLALAAEHGVRYLFEASVGGGIPIIRPLTNDLAANGIVGIDGILNGTTNYILTRMKNEGAALEPVLRDAQAKGYAEADPTADVDGHDAARKTVILAALAFGRMLDADAIPVEGIRGVTAEDVALAEALGMSVKLIGHAELMDGRLLAMVSPRMIGQDNPLYSVSDVFNGILVEGNMLGRAMFYGRGAGKLPTASAVASDIIDIAAHGAASPFTPHWVDARAEDVAPLDSYRCGNVFIMRRDAAADVPGALRTVTVGELTAVLTSAMTEAEAAAVVRANGGDGAVKRYRVL